MTILVSAIISAAVITAAFFINSSDESDRCAEALAELNAGAKIS